MFCILIAMNQNIFKAYDIRGKYPEELNEEAVSEIIPALVKHFKKGLPAYRRGKIIVGHDARLSSPKLYGAVIKSLETGDSKLEILHAGLMTTPMLYFLVHKLKAAGGIMITASHNPKEYNGLKVVDSKGGVMSGKEIYELYKALH